MPRVALIIAISIALALVSSAQRETPSVVGAPTFVSVEGRFTISLPERNGFSPLTIPTPVGNAQGAMLQWDTKEATFGVGYAEATQSLDDPDTAKQFFNGATELFKKLATANSGSVAAVRQITLDKYPGIEQRADLFTGSIIQRTYIVSGRIYEIVAVVKNRQREFETVVLGTLDSFKLLSDAEVTRRRAEVAAKAEPDPLPQHPVAKREGSDASDEGLRGRVKSVLTERQALARSQVRTRESLNIFNEHGNKLRTEFYDAQGNLNQIMVYGFIDGSRVAVSKWVPRENSPPPITAIGPPPGSKVKQPDLRFQNRFEFRYDDQKRLTEKKTFLNNGELRSRQVYKYNGNQREEESYSPNGSLSRRTVATLDNKGNKVEQTVFERDDSIGSRESFSYEFDSNGNWTKRTLSRIVKKDGREELQPYTVHYRTITYY